MEPSGVREGDWQNLVAAMMNSFQHYATIHTLTPDQMDV